jgi:hypothetical protein
MIIWLASYPKSGNTWVRSIISALLYNEDGIFNFNYIKKIKQFPQKEFFQDFTNSFYDIHEIKKNWLLAQEKLNLDNKIKFLKTHNLNCTIDNYAFTNKENTAATIYIVRDPRSLVNSISNHFSKSLDESKKFLLTSKMLSGSSEKNSLGGDVITFIGSWKEHYNFWTIKNENLLLIRYEDLVSKPYEELDKIIKFLNKYVQFQSSDEKKANIVKSTSFNSLKKMEEQGLFHESVYKKNTNKKVNFFNEGPKNVWRKNITKEMQNEIEEELEKEMSELKYI